MANRFDYGGSAVLHYSSLKDGQTPSGRLGNSVGGDIVTALNERGINTHLTFGLASFALDGDVRLWTPNDEEVHAGIEDIGAIRDIHGALGRRDEVTDFVNGNTTIINNPPVRRGDDKAYAAKEGIFGDRQVATYEIEISSSEPKILEIISFIEENFEGEAHVFAKPAKGAGSKGLYLIDMTAGFEETVRQIAAHADGKNYIFQIYIDNRVSLPSYIKPENEDQRRLLEKYKDAQKELRIFWFYGQGHELVWMPVIKVTEKLPSDGESIKSNRHYIYIDSETVPDELIDFCSETLSEFAIKAQVQEMSGAIDFAYGKAGSDNDAKWWVMEGNFWQPVPPTRTEHPVMRKQFVEATADQITRIVKSRI